MLSNYHDFIAYLESNSLQNIAALKAAERIKQDALYHINEEREEYAIAYEPKYFGYDLNHYKSSSLIHVTNIRKLEALDDYMHKFKDAWCVIKTTQPIFSDRLSELKSFHSYTAKQVALVDGTHILIKDNFNPGDEALLSNVHYSPDEANELISKNGFVIQVQNAGTIVASCFVFQNFKEVWEIGGVSTLAQHQRKGYAEQLVRYAAHLIKSSGKVLRYNVLASNTASVQLAIKCGFYKVVDTIHYEYRKLQ